MAVDEAQACSGKAVGSSVLIIDDHELFATALRLALREQGFEVHLAAITGAGAILAQAAELPAGLVILDLHLGHNDGGHPMDGVELVKPLRSLGWTVLVVSGSRDDAALAAAIAAGAAGSVAKSRSFDQLLRTVRAAAAGDAVMTDGERHDWLTRDHGYRKQERELDRRLNRLSRRELEVLELMAQGYKASAIAERFVVEMTTVRTQIRSILAKLDVNSQLEAVAMASRRRRR